MWNHHHAWGSKLGGGEWGKIGDRHTIILFMGSVNELAEKNSFCLTKMLNQKKIGGERVVLAGNWKLFFWKLDHSKNNLQGLIPGDIFGRGVEKRKETQHLWE